MGNEQSQSREERPRKLSKENNSEANENIVRINRTEMPEEFQAVLLSDNVVQQVMKSEQNRNNDQWKHDFDKELIKQREPNKRLNDESEIGEKQRIFEETTKKIENTFLNRHWPDACADEQKEIVVCLAKFPGKLLTCHSLLDTYWKCVSKLIDEQIEAKNI